MRTRGVWVLSGVVLPLLAGCQVIAGYEEFSLATGQGDGDAELVACAGLVPPQTQGSPMLAVPRADGSCFWMDEHEVTQAMYAEFVGSDPSGLSLPCSWNDEYYDDACEAASERITSDPDHPQTCVDQCDAEEYCRSVNKTLCRSSYTGNALEDDWGAACTNARTTRLPYGDEGAQEVCNVLGRGNETTTDVRTNTSCENQVGVRDLVGNVAEWTGGDDACETNSDVEDRCLLRGGSFQDGFQNTDCDSSVNPQRGETSDHVGFRCCNYEHE